MSAIHDLVREVAATTPHSPGAIAEAARRVIDDDRAHGRPHRTAEEMASLLRAGARISATTRSSLPDAVRSILWAEGMVEGTDGQSH